MGKQRLEEALAALHEELEAANAGELDDESMALLASLGADIARLIDKSAAEARGVDEDDDEHSVIAERLREAVGEFDASHPRLTEAVRQVASTLAGMGI